MIKNLLFLILFCVANNINAQNSIAADTKTSENINVKRVPTIHELKDALEGTFHIELNSSYKKILYTKAFFEAIQNARKDDEDVIIQWDKYTTITVYAAQRLNPTEEQ